jgi:hypothetical protein
LGEPEEHRDLLIFDRDRRGAQARIVRPRLEGQKNEQQRVDTKSRPKLDK